MIINLVLLFCPKCYCLHSTCYKLKSVIVKWAEHEADCSALSSVKVKDLCGSVTPLHMTLYVAWAI